MHRLIFEHKSIRYLDEVKENNRNDNNESGAHLNKI